MAQSLYASFMDASMAEKAVGALLDHGMLQEDISLVRNTDYGREQEGQPSATHGVSTTTGADAAAGAKIGTGAGAVIGILAGIASLVIPGFGIVVGGGALATAIGSALGTTAAGAIVGGVTGFMKDQGVPEAAAQRYQETLEKGGAVLQLTVPSGELDQAGAEQILRKYQATDVGAYARGMPQERTFPRSQPTVGERTSDQVRTYESSADTSRTFDQSTQPMVGTSIGAAGSRFAMGRPYREWDDTHRSHFREAFQRQYPSGQVRYDDYSDAYQYGYTLGNDERYCNRDWNQLEPELRADWESSHPGTWERFKDSIRYAWDRAMGRV